MWSPFAPVMGPFCPISPPDRGALSAPALTTPLAKPLFVLLDYIWDYNYNFWLRPAHEAACSKQAPGAVHEANER